MVTDNIDLNLLQELGDIYSSSIWYPYEFYYPHLLYPYVQPQSHQQVVLHSYLLQKLQEQQWEELEREIDMQRELRNREEEEQQWEKLEREIDMQRELRNREEEVLNRVSVAGWRLLAFLENDNSFLTPWNWNPDNAPVVNRGGGPSTFGQMMRFEPGSFFSDDLVYSSQRAESKYLSAFDAELVSDDSSDQKPKVGKGVEKASKGFDVEKVADQKAKGKGAEKVSDEDEAERLMNGELTKMDRCREFERNAKKGAKGKK